MARSVTLYNVFVASPDDVQEERIALDNIIKEIKSYYREQSRY